MKSNEKATRAREMQATVMSENRKQLHNRLLEARSALAKDKQSLFEKYEFDFPNKRLVSSCGNFHLQWKLRERPDAAESNNNRQTPRGVVVFVKLTNT